MTIGSPAVQAEVQVVREVLEGALPPKVATALMFSALHAVDAVPQTREDVLTLCRGPLSTALDAKVGEAAREIVIERIEQVLHTGDRTGTAIPLEFDEDGELVVDIDIGSIRPPPLDEGDVETTLAMPVMFKAPVSVMVVAPTFRFSERLVASLGDDRVYVTAAMSEKELRKGVFTAQPLLVVVDATSRATMDDDTLALALRALPDSAVSVVWGSDSDYGAGLSTSLRACQANTVLLDQHEGIEPLLDLILSRYDPDE